MKSKYNSILPFLRNLGFRDRNKEKINIMDNYYFLYIAKTAKNGQFSIISLIFEHFRAIIGQFEPFMIIFKRQNTIKRQKFEIFDNFLFFRVRF